LRDYPDWIEKGIMYVHIFCGGFCGILIGKFMWRDECGKDYQIIINGSREGDLLGIY
jgi:hypothetical protein